MNSIFTISFLVFLTILQAPFEISAENVDRTRFIGSGPFSFDYLLGEDTNFTSPASVLFVDHDGGKTVICYVNVGAWKNWRSDASYFPESVLGNDYEGWPGERWLDVRNLNVLLPIMERRFEDARAKGCQGIDPDNINGWSVDSGFPLTFTDQLTYNHAIATEIRKLGMWAGLKNTNEQAVQLEPYIDFVVSEECVQWQECDDYDIFIQRNKPVYIVEYTEYWTEANFRSHMCPLVPTTRKSYILKHYNLHNDFIVSCL